MIVPFFSHSRFGDHGDHPIIVSSPGFVSTGGVATDVVLELSNRHGIHQHHLLLEGLVVILIYIIHTPKHDIQL
jgi:hypothetical protein